MAPTADKSAFFSQLLRDWMSEKPGRNLHVLARNSGLSYSNLRAMEAGKSDVTLDTALRLLRFIQADAATTQNVFNFFPDIAPTLAQLARQRIQHGVYRLPSQKACRAAVEIHAKRRMSWESWQCFVGPGADAVAQELMDLGLIHQDDDHYHATQGVFQLNSPDLVHPLLRLFLDNVHHDAPWNLMDARFARLKPEAAAAIQSILEDAGSRIMRIKENPDNAGDLTVAWGHVMTLF
jgi:hypothetical protein